MSMMTGILQKTSTIFNTVAHIVWWWVAVPLAVMFWGIILYLLYLTFAEGAWIGLP